MRKTTRKEVYIRRLKSLREFIKGVPAATFNLSDAGGDITRTSAAAILSGEDCGSAGCIAGWGKVMPAYLRWARAHRKNYRNWDNLAGYLGVRGMRLAQWVDGEPYVVTLFSASQHSRFGEIGYNSKPEAIRRIDLFIKAIEGSNLQKEQRR